MFFHILFPMIFKSKNKAKQRPMTLENIQKSAGVMIMAELERSSEWLDKKRYNANHTKEKCYNIIDELFDFVRVHRMIIQRTGIVLLMILNQMLLMMIFI